MMRDFLKLTTVAFFLGISAALAQSITGGGGGSGAPSGAAGGVLSGTYPNPGSNMACSDLTNEGPYCVATQGQLPGIAASTAASAGNIGEEFSNSAGTVSLTSGAAANAGQITVGAGHWIINCHGSFSGAGTTVASDAWLSVGTTSATPNGNVNQSLRARATLGTDSIFQGSTGTWNVHPSGSTTYFCVGQATFTTSTYGVTATISALRVQ